MKTNLIKRLTLGLACLVTLSSCGAPIETNVVANEETTLNAEGGGTLVSGIVKVIKNVGSKALGKAIASWGLTALGAIFDAAGISLFSETDYTTYFEEINERLDNIEKTLDEIKISLDQNESTRVMDNIRAEFNKMNNVIDPVVAGLADCADRAAKTTDETELAAILVEEENFYNNYIKTLRGSNSFAEKVMNLAYLITNPSSNTKNTLMRCFNVTSLDIPGIYAWDSLRINSQQEFLTYIINTLLKATMIAFVEISYEYTKSSSSAEKALWNTTNENLCESVSNALDLLQKEATAVLDNEEQVNNGTLTHIKTGISLNKRLGVSSYDKEVAHNILSYRKEHVGGSMYDVVRDYYRYILRGPEDRLYQSMISEYATHLTFYGLKTDDFTFMDYLEYIGFEAKKDLNNYSGLFWKHWYHHTGAWYKNEYDKFEVTHISKDGKQTDSKICQIADRVARIKQYEVGPGYSEEWLVFLKPNSDYVAGSYSELFLDSNDSFSGPKYDYFPWEFSYVDAVNNNTLGYCDPSW